MSIEEQYQELLKYRKIQPSSILINKKANAWEYFRNLTNVSLRNLENNLRNNIQMYYAPLRQIHGSNLVCWPVKNGDEIYIDEEFALKNELLANIQLQHEVLHCLANRINGEQSHFGYVYDRKSGKSNYIGINEATTQMFAEDISGIRLNEKTDYLFFIKNIMRVMKVLFGEELIAGQYLNNNIDFTLRFNDLTSYKFEPFSLLMNDVYYLSKNKMYGSLNEKQIEELNKKQQILLIFTTNLINQFEKNDKDIVRKVCQEIQDYSFLDNLNLQTMNISSSPHSLK